MIARDEPGMSETRGNQTWMEQLHAAVRQIGGAVRTDWRGARYLPFAVLLAIIAGLVAAAYYANQPKVPHDPDSINYLHMSHTVFRGHLVGDIRTPVYPMFIEVIQVIAGSGNLAAISAAQAALYVLAVVGIYGLAGILLRGAWLAFVVSMPLALNVLLLSYVAPILSEALTLFLLVAFALALAWYVFTTRARSLWLASGLLFAAGMTRPEWIFFGVVLIAFALVVAWQRDQLKRLLPHALSILLVFYALCGAYVLVNAAQHDVPGISANQNLDLLGKVMQYGMQNEAPPEYAAITAEVNRYVAAGDYDPFHVMAADPALQQHHFALCGTYAKAIILHHPAEFALRTVPVIFQSVTVARPHQPVVSGARFGAPLLALHWIAARVQTVLISFPVIALGWLIAFIWRRRQPDERVTLLCGLALTALFGLVITSAATYGQYARMDTPFNPLMVLVVGSTIVVLVRGAIGRRGSGGRRPSAMMAEPAGVTGERGE